MAIWDKSECETFFAGEQPSAVETCVVRLDGSHIVIDAGSANGGWMYEGDEVGPDHFQLRSTTHGGKGTLHRCPGDEAFDGSWHEGGIYGMWRITLGRSNEE